LAEVGAGDLAGHLARQGLSPALLAQAVLLVDGGADATLAPPPTTALGTGPGDPGTDVSARPGTGPLVRPAGFGDLPGGGAPPLRAPGSGTHPAGAAGSGAGTGAGGQSAWAPPPDDSATLAPGASGSGSTGGGVEALRGALRAEPGTPLPAGARLGGYQLERVIARGGMGAVFIAEQTSIGRRVALKVLLAGEMASEDEVSRFHLEARAASKLSHPNVVPVYEVGVAEGLQYLTMELVEGGSLRDRVREEGGLRPQLALAIVEQVARGVAAAHEAGIIHRDLKPHNVLLTKDDVAKVMDFGLAKEIASDAGLTLSGALLGTPAYMAPEQAGGEVVGPPADVYGIGAILYECLTGQPPHQGATLPNLINAVLTKEPTPPRELRPTLHKDVETICLKALRKDPEQRYASAAALADDAGRWLAGEAIEARPPTRSERLGRWVRGHALLVAICVTLVLSASAAGLYVQAFQARERQRAEETREREAQAIRAEAQTFRDLRRAALARAGALAKPADLGALQASIAALDAEVEQTAAALDKLSDSARAALEEVERSPLELGPARAALWEGLGSTLAGPHRPPPHVPPPAALEAWAQAYALSPASPAGRAALARIVLSREDGLADDLRRELLATPEPPLRSALLLAQAKARLASLDLAGASSSLARLELGSAGSDSFGAGAEASLLTSARRLAGVIKALSPRREVTLEAEGDPAEVRISRPGLLTVLTSSAEIVGLRFRPGVTEPERVRFVPPSSRSRPGVYALSWPVGQEPLSARVFGKRLEVLTPDGRITYQRTFLAQSLIDLRFVELDGDPQTRELALSLGPNAGDGFLIRLDGQGRPVPREGRDDPRFPLDPRGLASPNRPRAACFLTSVAGGKGTPLVVSRGAWGANDITILTWRGEGGGSLGAGPRREVGHTRAMAWAPLPSGSHELVAAHVLGEEPWQLERWSKRGLAVYALDEAGGVQTPPRLSIPLTEVSRESALIHKGLLGLLPLYVAGRRLVLATFEGGQIDRPGTKRAVLIDLEQGALLVNQLASAGVWGSLLTAGDVFGSGAGVLVLRGPETSRTLILQGATGGEALRPGPKPSALSLELAASRAVANLSSLGFGERALERLLAEERRGGPTAKSEALALSVVEAAYAEPSKVRKEAQPGGRLDPRGTPAEPLRPRADWIRLCQRFLQGGAQRSRRARARAQLLLARELTRSGFDALSPEAIRELDELLGDVSADALSDAQREEFGALQSRLRVRQSARTSRGLSVDFQALSLAKTNQLSEAQAAQANALHASNPFRVHRLPAGGLRVLVAQGVEVSAGVPVHVPEAGALRLELEFAIRGRTWNGLVEVGLVRSAAGLEPGARPRGLTFGTRLWQAASDIFSSRHQFAVGVDGPALVNPRRPVHRQGSPYPLTQSIPYPHTEGGRFRVVIEHEPRTRWTRFGLWRRIRRPDKTWEEVLISDREGKSLGSFSPGVYLLGAWGGFPFAIDYTNQTSPDADLILLSGRVDVSERQVSLAGRAAQSARSLAGGRLVQGRSLPPEFLAGPWRERLWRAAHFSRLGDARRAVAEIEAALREAPLTFFRELETSARDLEPELREAVQRALRQRLRALAGAKSAPELEERAVIQALRTEPHEALADLQAAERLEPKPSRERSELRLWVLLCVTSNKNAKKRGELPLVASVKRAPRPYAEFESFWTPREGPWEGIAARARAAVKAGLSGAGASGIERWIWVHRGLASCTREDRGRWILARYQLGGRANLYVRDMTRAWAADPKSPRALRFLIQAYFDTGRYLEGLDFVARVKGKLDLPLQEWRQRYAQRPEWPEVEAALAR